MKKRLLLFALLFGLLLTSCASGNAGENAENASGQSAPAPAAEAVPEETEFDWYAYLP